MKIYLILYLSIIVNTYISGLSGVMLKQFNLELKKYNIVYIIINIFILVISFTICGILNIPYLIPFFNIGLFLILLPFFLSSQFFLEYRWIYFTKNKKVIYKIPRDRKKIITIGILEEFSYRFFILNSLIFLTKNILFSIVICSLLYALNHIYIIRNSQEKKRIFLSKFIFGIFCAISAYSFGLFFSILLHVIYNWVILYGLNFIVKKEINHD